MEELISVKSTNMWSLMICWCGYGTGHHKQWQNRLRWSWHRLYCQVQRKLHGHSD